MVRYYCTLTVYWGTIIISIATALVCSGHVQRVGVGMYIPLMAIGLEIAVGYEGMKARWQPLPDTHCLHATTRVETAQSEGFGALIRPY